MTVSESKASKTYCYDHPRPAVTADIVVFRRAAGHFDVLLIKRAREPFKGFWALPGGFVDENESLESAAARELLEETGISNIDLEQIGAFGDPGRDPRGHTVSVVFAVVIDGAVNANAGDDAAEVAWHSMQSLPKLAFDHQKILTVALKRMVNSQSQRTGE